VTAGGGDSSPGFVTIHDYVMAVHPWLLAHETDIRLAIDEYPKWSLNTGIREFYLSNCSEPAVFEEHERCERGESGEMVG
jgi:hypothetical protein